jgi:hypothetical protein
MPSALGDEIAAALRAQHLLVNPVVVVSVVEYGRRGVTVAGAVRTPIKIQDLGNLRVLAALFQAGGLLPEAGPEIIVDQPDGTTQRVSVRKLFDRLHPERNIPIGAGAQITVPECERVFIAGVVKRPFLYLPERRGQLPCCSCLHSPVGLTHSAATRPTSTGQSRGVKGREK